MPDNPAPTVTAHEDGSATWACPDCKWRAIGWTIHDLSLRFRTHRTADHSDGQVSETIKEPTDD